MPFLSLLGLLAEHRNDIAPFSNGELVLMPCLARFCGNLMPGRSEGAPGAEAKTRGGAVAAHCNAGRRNAEGTEEQEMADYGEVGGAACVTRTRDPIITNDVLYQLS